MKRKEKLKGKRNRKNRMLLFHKSKKCSDKNNHNKNRVTAKLSFKILMIDTIYDRIFDK